jgi:hypothetical protein
MNSLRDNCQSPDSSRITFYLAEDEHKINGSSLFATSRFSTRAEPQVERGHQEKIEQRRGHKPAENDDRQRVLDIVVASDTSNSALYCWARASSLNRLGSSFID